MSDNVLVTGAAGFVGQHLVNRLVKDGHNVTAVDIKQKPPESYSEYVGENVDYIRGSLIHKNFVDSVLFPFPDTYDKVFHLAAIVGVDRYMDPEDPLYITNVNINGTRYLLEKIRGTDTHFLYTSTSEVYGKNPEIPWFEEDDQILGPPTVSRWGYSSMKRVCEQMIHMLDEIDSDITTTVIRPFNLYGAHQRPKFVIPKFVDMVLNNEAPTVYGEGTQKRCFTYIEDFIEGMIAASERDPATPDVYNLGNTTETEISNLAEMIVDAAGINKSPVYIDPEEVYDTEYDQPDRRIPNTSRAENHLNWEATTSVKEGIKKTIEAERQN
jgi:UDP-glucose 4-epimerase